MVAPYPTLGELNKRAAGAFWAEKEKSLIKSLSGRFLVLSIIFVMAAEVLIFVPSVARFRQDYLAVRLEKAQIASLSVLASENTRIPASLASELLGNAGVGRSASAARSRRRCDPGHRFSDKCGGLDDRCHHAAGAAA